MEQKANPDCRNCDDCIYRGYMPGYKTFSCDYMIITGHMRGGKAEDCTKFKQGEPLGLRKALTIKEDFI